MTTTTTPAESRRPPKRAAFLAALLLTLATVAGVVWRETHFDARLEALPDAPFDLLVQAGVSDGEVAAVRDGLRAADRHLRTVLGTGVTQRVEVRIARSQGCQPLASPAGPPTGWATDRLLCLNTRAPAWRSQYARDPALAANVAAHEHIHNLQGQLGCHRARQDHEWLWLFEGTAVHLGFQSLVTAGRWPDATATEQIRRWGVADPVLGPLPDYATDGTGVGDPAYALFHLATRYLDEQAARPTALVDFCRAVGTGQPWRDAFAEAFGMPVDTFYTRFAAARPQLIAAL
ncbi:hypothetical protein AB0G04_33060 [Actinoplanes sp. NPDC023801]|uniref:hypothetical protein n=1 Tax=Actinoplanes sp. NPDC023801 TaxID=3154595 RepID=UPI0033D38410